MMLTKNVQGHVKIRRVPRFNILRSNPHKISWIINNPYDEHYVDDDSIVFGRRRKLDFEVKDDELSDYVKIRLMLARMKAMKVYSMASFSK
jgi:hypothetical protein